MAEYEALFSEGTKITVQADSMRIESGMVQFEQNVGGHAKTVCLLSVDQLLFVFDTEADVSVEEAVYDDEDDD